MLQAFCEEFQSPHTPWEIFPELYRDSEVCFFLDSVRYASEDQRYSCLAADPFLEVTIPSPRPGARPMLEVRDRHPARHFRVPASRLGEILRLLMARYQTRADARFPFFSGGAVGYFGYEMASLFEDVHFRKKPDPGLPWMYLGFFRDLIVYDHRDKKYFLITHLTARKGKSKQMPPAARRRLDQMKERFRGLAWRWQESFDFSHFRPGLSRNKFENMVRRAKGYIAAGDIYQANLSQRFTFQCEGSRLKLYDRLRTINPSPFSSFFKIRDLEIISSSPERLVRKRGRHCETRPIAGTRPRRAGGRTAASLKRELLANEKERAEHVMLVDLERNDLGRVCQWKSVKVEEMMKTEKYSHVIHIVSKITGELARGRDGFDLIKAMFPGGTITGCPKVRCMEIIDELEPVRRGLYTGSLGYLGFSGDLDLNIVIRTLVLKGNKGYLQVGAGIVHDSDPAREYEETLHKGEALAQALTEASS